MTGFRLPLYAKMLLCFLVNLLLLTALGYGFMRMQFRVGLDWMLAGPTGERLDELANSLSRELKKMPESEWPQVLNRYDVEHGITFALFSSKGEQILGKKVVVPREVSGKLIDKRSPEDPPPPKPNEKVRRPPPTDDRMPPKPRFILRSENPTRYWAGIHLDLVYHEWPYMLPLTLVMISDNLTAGGLFFDPWPWVALAFIGLLLSLLVWLPFVNGMTRAIQRLNIAARCIAQGGFGERVPDKRGDELGELAISVNAMAGQLGDYVAQQRRITRDVAHELCSPIARMQMALGVVEQRATPDQSGYIKKLDNELQHMATLVEEVLAFSKAEALSQSQEATEFNLLELVEEVITREASGFEVVVEVPADMKLRTLREAVDRALGNVLRNAVRYAGHAGTLRIQAYRENGKITLRISDEGPGIPEEALSRIFEPFYRPEAARGRHTGGSGLGLAIVKRCIEACGGNVAARNRAPSGLEVEMVI